MKKYSVYTRGGDDGSTSLVGGIRVSKTDVRLEAYGTVDELNSNIGLLVSEIKSESDVVALERIQNNLFVVGSYLATDQSKTHLNDACVLYAQETEMLERAIDEIEEMVPEQKSFILPGGCREASLAHVCRTICRRAERRILALEEDALVSKEILTFMNRLSDYLFILSRKLNFIANIEEKKWQKTCK
jgi:cob(I)alamin adenosyltransferase